MKKTQNGIYAKIPDIVDIKDIAMAENVWVWTDRFLRREVNYIAGMRATGKSTFLVYLAFKVLCGGNWPHLDDEPIDTGSVIYMAAEDSMSTAVRPKMEALMFDSGMQPLPGNRFVTIKTITTHFDPKSNLDPVTHAFNDLKANLEELRLAVCAIGNVKLVLIDPLISFSGDTKANDEKSVRDFLTPLRNFAEEEDLAVIGLRHLNKDETKSASQRTGGSTAWQDVPRGGWLVGIHPDDVHFSDPQEVRRTLCLLKCNPAIKPTNLIFKLRSVAVPINGKPSRGLPVCDFDAEHLFNMTADDVLDLDARKKKRSAVTEASEWLYDMLVDGPQMVTELKKEAKKTQVAWRTLERAKTSLGVESHPIKIQGKVMGHKWSLPSS